MIYIIIYISGIITTLSLIGFFYQLSKSKELEKNQLPKSIKPEKRTATYIWDGWHYSDNPSKKWSVNFELREVAISEDETKSKFEVISVYSEELNDKWTIKEYSDYFMKKKGGGWLDTNSSELTWIKTTSRSEERNKKIEEILKREDE
jgi:hypothetical protein